MRRVMTAITLVAGIAFGATGARVLDAQQAGGITRVMLLRTDLQGAEGREAVLGTAEVAPGMAAGRHYHHGQEIGYVLQGTAVLEIEGKPPLPLKAGDSYLVDARVPHDARATGSAPAKVLAIYIVEKGKPLAVPVQ